MRRRAPLWSALGSVSDSLFIPNMFPAIPGQNVEPCSALGILVANKETVNVCLADRVFRLAFKEITDKTILGKVVPSERALFKQQYSGEIP